MCIYSPTNKYHIHVSSCHINVYISHISHYKRVKTDML